MQNEENQHIKVTETTSSDSSLFPSKPSLPTGTSYFVDMIWDDQEKMVNEGKSLEVRKCLTYYELAKLYYDKSDLERARQCFLNSLKWGLADKDEDVSVKFKILKICGFIIRIYTEYLDQRQVTKYIDICEQTVKSLEKSLHVLNAEYFYNLGMLETYKQNPKAAKDYFLMAFERGCKEGQKDVKLKSLYAFSMNCFLDGDWEQALFYLNKLNNLFKMLQKDYLYGAMYKLYGDIYLKLRDFKKALSCYEKSNTLLRGKVCWNLYGYILLNKGIIHRKMGDLRSAILIFNLAEEATDKKYFKKLSEQLHTEISDLKDDNVDLYLDKTNNVVLEKTMGKIDFKHRFILLEILFLLAQNRGTYFTKDDFSKLIWKEEYNPLIHDKLIYTSISRLRKLIEPQEVKFKYILRGKNGYTFNPMVKIRFFEEIEQHTSKPLVNVDFGLPV